ncbi:MAG: MFS transporter [Hyphomicrobiaceae bacterium]|nr:MFS transporter [Hyphomicrobiaceae bacterium]
MRHDETAPPADRWWLAVVAAASIAAIAMGLRQVMGLYLKPISMDLGLGRQVFSLAIAIANLVWGIAAPFVGAASDRYGAWLVAVMGGVATAIGLYLTYAAHSETMLLVAGVFLGLGVAGAGVNAMVGAAARAAPVELRTQAIAMLGMGSGVGILIALPYAHVLIEELGWKSSLIVLLFTALTILPLAYLISGQPHRHVTGAASQSLGEALREAFRLPSYWLLNAGFFVCGFHVAFFSTHLPAYVADQGLAPGVAVTALTVVGLGNLAGTWAAGQSARFIPKRVGLSLIYLGRAIVFLGFLFLPITPQSVIILSFALGVLWLSTIPLTSGLVGTFFGAQWMTMLYGIVFFFHQIGSFLGAWSAGFLFDATKSYDIMWWISLGLAVFAALIHLPIQEESAPRHSPQPAE